MAKFYERIKHYCELLRKHLVVKEVKVENIKFKSANYKSKSALPIDTENWENYSNDSCWGGCCDSHAWFAFDVDVSKSYPFDAFGNSGKGTGTNPNIDVYLEVKTDLNGWDAANPQFMIYLDGHLTQGMDTNHMLVRLDECKRYKVVLYGYTGAEISDKLKLLITLKFVDKNTEKLFYDIIVPFEMLEYADTETKEYSETLHVLNSALNILQMSVPNSPAFRDSVILTIEFLQKELYNRFADKNDANVACVGHTHIDIAWLWSVRQSREKAQRSFATVSNYMKQFPHYKFFSSQPILYKMVKEESPELYSEIKEWVKQGRWEVEGAMWVEADCNLISGESLVRQILFGKQFFKDEFERENEILWLPDVFGYSAALPQILKKSGIKYFVTSKISWNDTNKMPYDTFNWKGIDGTEVLTYFITTQDKKQGATERYTTYVGMATPKQVAGAYARFQQKELSDEVMLLYGYGDGGGGATKEHLEYLTRMDKGLPLCPKAETGFAIDFLERLNSKVCGNKRLPKWSGELYLEYHRGTYTSMAKNKRNNRKSEFMLMNAEALAVTAACLLGSVYPREIFHDSWETILTNQFHDIIPGSSIQEVYDTTDIEYASVFNYGENLINNIYDAIAKNTTTKTGGMLVFNPNSFECSGNVTMGDKSYFVANIPSKGYSVVRKALSSNKIIVSDNHLENNFFAISFDDNYNIISVFDKRVNRQVLKPNIVSGLIAYEDLPFIYDAWEISDYYTEKSWLITDLQSVEKVDFGNKAGFKIKRKFYDSVIEQTICLYSDMERIDFDNIIDWKTEHILVKAEFNVDINATSAVYDIQFGAVERPTTKNNSWEQAKFEVCAHKFADYSEYDYGVSLLNDCKYGYSIHDGVMSLTLLKCPTYPNPSADKDRHIFTYSLMPHIADYREAGVVQNAYLLNAQLAAVDISPQKGSLPEKFSFLRASTDNVIVETIKLAENSQDVIVRAYEAYNKSTICKIKFGIPVSQVFLCDLMENEICPLDVADNEVTISFKPYEIISLKIKKE